LLLSLTIAKEFLELLAPQLGSLGHAMECVFTTGFGQNDDDEQNANRVPFPLGLSLVTDVPQSDIQFPDIQQAAFRSFSSTSIVL